MPDAARGASSPTARHIRLVAASAGRAAAAALPPGLAGGVLAAAFVAVAAATSVHAQTGSGDLFLGQPERAPEAAAARDDAGATAGTGAGEARTARGVVQAAEEATISSELAARITELPFDDGDRFAAGDVLVAFDCALFQARRAQAVAQLQAARTKLENARQLQQTNAIGRLDVQLAEAEARRTGAQLAEADVAVERCTIVAPFDGRVVETLVNAHEVAGPGAELLTVVSGGPMEATLLVPSDWLVWLAPGQGFAFVVDETGAELSGEVVRLGARVDPVSQTAPVRTRLSDEGGTPLVPGMSGTARFPAAAAGDG
jgi:RND family efflux transporter MFP subunit